MLLLLLACAHHGSTSPVTAPAPAAPGSTAPEAAGATDPCAADVDRGADLYNAGKVEPAAELWKTAYATCGAGYGLLARQAVVSSRAERYDEAARLAIRELAEKDPTPLALKLLIALKGKVSVEMTSTVYNLGRTPEAAIVVPDIQGEYAWIRFLICGGKEEALKQSLAPGPRGYLDRMEFVCPGSSTPQELYFDYSADPTEKALQDALGNP